jgi:large subunit ribosomal protein L29
MKVDELRKKDSNELQKELTVLLKQQFKMRMQRGSGQSIKTHLIKEVRRDVARIKTILKEVEMKAVDKGEKNDG